jgi:hypothetical protein
MPLTVRGLQDVLRLSNPEVVFLSETHLDNFLAECLRRRLQMDCKIVSRSYGRSGGVILLWKKEIRVEQIFAAPNYIDVCIVEILRRYGDLLEYTVNPDGKINIKPGIK